MYYKSGLNFDSPYNSLSSAKKKKKKVEKDINPPIDPEFIS